MSEQQNQNPYNPDGTLRNDPGRPPGAMGYQTDSPPDEAQQQSRQDEARQAEMDRLQQRADEMREQGKTAIAEAIDRNVQQRYPDLLDENAERPDHDIGPPDMGFRELGAPLTTPPGLGSEDIGGTGRQLNDLDPSDRGGSGGQKDDIRTLHEKLDQQERLIRKLIQMMPAASKDFQVARFQ